MLKTQLILKNVVSLEDWELMSQHIQYDFLYDNHFSELKDSELLNERIGLVASAEPYVGKYFSQDYVRRKILRQTDEEIVEQDKIMKEEIKAGIIPDPNQMQIDPTTGQPIPGLGMGNLGSPVIEPDLESQSKTAEIDSKDIKGGEI